MARQRQTTTKIDLRNALSQLLLQQNFESITIRELTEKAGINRGYLLLALCRQIRYVWNK